MILIFLVYAGCSFMWLWTERVDNFKFNGLPREQAEDRRALLWIFFCGWWMLPLYLYFKWKHPEDYK